MGIIISSSTVHENIKRIKEFEIGLEENEEFIAMDEKSNKLFLLKLNAPSTHNYRGALKFVNTAISLSGVIRKDVHHLALMDELATHYYLGNADLLFSRLASFKRMVDKGDVIFSFERQVPKLLNDLFNHPNETKYFSKLFKIVDDSLEEDKMLVYKPYLMLYLLKAK
ncbi:MAG: hypothetical protein IPJ60_14815 [Sphingobacteriaceae bacterium]|nr:hypothetical protein [Sphingobacteriaceae bacterium]